MKLNDDGTVTISFLTYKLLIEDRNILQSLYAAGVDNWEGYSDAFPDEEEDDE